MDEIPMEGQISTLIQSKNSLFLMQSKSADQSPSSVPDPSMLPLQVILD